MFNKVVSSVGRHSTIFNNIQSNINIQFAESDRHGLLSKTIIGCATTGAAKYTRLIRTAKPDIVLVEEAGEILESHILTALAPSVKRIILIGDHKQLQPKINTYALNMEKGDGFDLNQSLFERLIMQGATHTALRKQHQMALGISAFPRALTYPDLLDGPKTIERPRILGLANRVIWFNHSHQEDSDKTLKDRQDPILRESKRNTFEAEIILQRVKYMGQQGYFDNKMVVLAPYVAQICILQEIFHKNKNGLQISDMDKLVLTCAGLISEIAAKVGTKALRLSSIDNYQGEESDIVIASMTRCNDSGDIGFMYAPERLNVLVTRARNCLIMIGNIITFMKSMKGRERWPPFFDLLQQKGAILRGYPRCVREASEKDGACERTQWFRSGMSRWRV
ncbi:AAA domain containing protein [Rhypophila sp. PSN 637]